MNARDIRNVAQTLRSGWVYASKYADCYRELAQSILDTVDALPPFWQEGLEAVVADTEDAYVRWGSKFGVIRTFTDDREGQNWYFAFAAMSQERLEYYLKEFG